MPPILIECLVGDRHGDCVAVGAGREAGLARRDAAVDRARLRRAGGSAGELPVRADSDAVAPHGTSGAVGVKNIVQKVGALRHITRGQRCTRSGTRVGGGGPGSAAGAGDRDTAGAVDVAAARHVDVAEGNGGRADGAIGGDGRARVERARSSRGDGGRRGDGGGQQERTRKQPNRPASAGEIGIHQ